MKTLILILASLVALNVSAERKRCNSDNVGFVVKNDSTLYYFKKTKQSAESREVLDLAPVVQESELGPIISLKPHQIEEFDQIVLQKIDVPSVCADSKYNLAIITREGKVVCAIGDEEKNISLEITRWNCLDPDTQIITSQSSPYSRSRR